MTKPTYEELERSLTLLEELAAHRQESEFKSTDLWHQTSRGVTCHPMINEKSLPPVENLYLETNPTGKDLRAPNADYRQLVDAMQELLFVVGENGDLLFANQRATDFLIGGRGGESIGSNLREFLSPSQTTALLEGCQQCLSTQMPRQQQLQMHTESGSRWFDHSLTPIHYGSPPQPAVMSLMLDITEQKVQQEDLRHSETQYRTLFATMQEGAVYFNSPAELLSMNPAAQQILGYAPSELQHRLCDDSFWRIAYDNGPRCTKQDNPIARCFATGQSETGTILKTRHHQTGRNLWIVANVTPQFKEYSTVPDQVIATFNDITHHIRLRESHRARLYLLKNTPRWSLARLLQETIAKVGALVGSPIGFYHLVDEDERLVPRHKGSPLTPFQQGQFTDRNGHHHPTEPVDVWLDCLQQRRTVMHNDGAALPPEKGWPAGPAQIKRKLVTPVFRNNKIVAILGIGNKTRDYTEEDATLMQHFADLAWELVEQKQMEEERQESRRKLKALISNLPGMVFSVEADDARSIRFVSDGCLELTGYPAQELVTEAPCSLATLIHPEDRAPVVATVRRALANRRSYEVEYRLLHRDGRERTIFERGAGAVHRHSDQSLIEGFAIDITEQKNAARQIAESHQQLLTILDSIEAQIFVADMATHEVLFVNQRMKELFTEGARSKPCYQAFQAQDQPCDFCTNDRLLDERGEPGPTCQWEHRNPITGRWYVNHDRAVHWLNGKIVRMQVAFDNTERKEAELKLRQVQKMEVIGLLAGGVAHDFNNILSVILGYATMALEELGESGLRVKRDVLQIQKAGLRAKELVKQILAFSHHTEEHFQPMKLHLIIKEVLKMLRSSFPSTIGISAQISMIDLTIQADPTQMHQVLMNLCTNALHAMKDGGALTIGLQQVHLEGGQRPLALLELPAGSYVRLSVKDTGVGIPADLLDKIFDPFFTTKNEGEGTGLGLAMVQGIVTGHKGAITVDSSPGTGTTFSLYLPELVIAAQQAVEDDEEALPGGTETILVVDDEPAVAMIMQRLLNHLGYTVEAFTDSARALEAYTKEPQAFDLVITDMTMPKLTGLAIARAMLALRPGQPIILYTGFSEAVDEEIASAEGIKALLSKPISQETLAQTVRRTLDQDKAQITPAA